MKGEANYSPEINNLQTEFLVRKLLKKDAD